MKGMCFLLMLSLTFYSCASQKINVKKLFSLSIYDNDCKVVIPEYFTLGKYYYYEEGFLYSLNKATWCALPENTNRFEVPSKIDFKDYRIINDSTCVLFSVNDYKVLNYINFKSGALIRTDTLLYDRTFGDEFIDTGGSFGLGNIYYLSARNTDSRNVRLFKYDLIKYELDTIDLTYSLENKLVKIISNDNYIIVNHGIYLVVP